MEPVGKHKHNNQMYGTTWITQNSSGTKQAGKEKYKTQCANEPAEKHKQIQQPEERNQLTKIKSSGTVRGGKEKAITKTLVRSQLDNAQSVVRNQKANKRKARCTDQLANIQSSGTESAGKQTNTRTIGAEQAV
ncbi:hypothetical protein CHS0354_024973 [Potamilus streckersoni]|uniref:Uncharacterized protein n=1 Tax=Potamilus streckersoni TaxID=2493646 RepID=A0AAE0T2X4_9BIVA|nr:hypothetical protein CHS0354_024973 [Potamilus streckersoni]